MTLNQKKTFFYIIVKNKSMDYIHINKCMKLGSLYNIDPIKASFQTDQKNILVQFAPELIPVNDCKKYKCNNPITRNNGEKKTWI